MFKLVLATSAALLGVLAIYGEPPGDLAGSATAASIGQAPAPAPVRKIDPASQSAELIMPAAVEGPVPVRLAGPMLRPSPEHAVQDRAAAPSGAQLFVTADRVNLRRAAQADAVIVAKLSKGAVAEPLGPTTGAWVKITADGSEGYISSRFLSAKPPVQ